MASGINRAPLGLQSLLDTKTLGRNPDALSELVRPSIDMSPFYWAQQRWRVIEAEGVASAVGAIAATRITVPQEEVWLVPNVAARLVASAPEGRVGFTARALIDSVIGASGQTGLVSWYNNNQFGNAFETVQAIYNAPYPMLWPSGTRFEIFNGFVLSVAATFRLSVVHLPLRI